MISFRNFSQATITARIDITDERTGQPVPCPSVTIQPNQSIAVSFLPNNGLGPNPPQDFQGHAEINVTYPGPFGPVDATPNVAIYALVTLDWHSGATIPFTTQLKPKTGWSSAYAIPNFDDTKGTTGRRWITGLSVQNFASTSVNCTLKYTVNQAYPQAGQTYTVHFTLPPNGGIRKMLDEFWPELKAIPTEGFLDLTTDAPAFLYPSALVASEDFSFMAKLELM